MKAQFDTPGHVVEFEVEIETREDGTAGPLPPRIEFWLDCEGNDALELPVIVYELDLDRYDPEKDVAHYRIIDARLAPRYETKARQN